MVNVRKYDHDVVLDMWAAGAAWQEIAATIGATWESTVHNIVQQARRLGDPRATRRHVHDLFDWTDETIARLKALYADGLSASAIAADLGCGSRNAIIGKARRLGLSSPKTPRSTRHAMPKVEREKIVKPPRMEGRRKAKPNPSLIAAKIATLPKVKAYAEPAPAAVLRMPADAPRGAVAAVMGRGSNQCGFPIGDPRNADFRFCCAEVEQEGAIYCPTHQAIVFAPAPARDGRKKQAARDKYAEPYRRHSMDVAA